MHGNGSVTYEEVVTLVANLNDYESEIAVFMTHPSEVRYTTGQIELVRSLFHLSKDEIVSDLRKTAVKNDPRRIELEERIRKVVVGKHDVDSEVASAFMDDLVSAILDES